MYELQVEKMSCGHCVNAVTKSVQAIDAQASVEVDLAQRTVRVQSATELAKIVAAIADAGYPVTASATV